MNRMTKVNHNHLVVGLSIYLLTSAFITWSNEKILVESINAELQLRAKKIHEKLIEDYEKVMQGNNK
jgi:hypothetical protein